MNFLQIEFSNKKLDSNLISSKAVSKEGSESFHKFLQPLMNVENFNDEMLMPALEGNSQEEMISAITEVAFEQLTILNDIPEELKDDRYYEAVNYLLGLIEKVGQSSQKNIDLSTFKTFKNTTESPTTFLSKEIEQLNKIMALLKDKLSVEEFFGIKKENTIEKILKIVESKLDWVTSAQKNLDIQKNIGLNDSNTQKINNEHFAPTSIKAEHLHVPKQVIAQLTINTASEQTAKSQLLEKMEQLLLRSRVQTVSGKQNIMIRLTPEHLGTVHIKLQQIDGSLNARIIAHSATAAKLLEGSLFSLKANLQASNIQIDKIEIVFQDTTKTLQQEKNHSNPEQQQPNKQQQKKEDDSKESSFHELLEIEMETSEVG
ncbi:flagellar hook-length control protein FliK [Bacillus sp. FJAT-45066]|uniref:flagellar hook-length control protein FliK n=1 Tax=Bacillus sp. FJAT-45066 TaxID=2011010 RepID=UPI000BB76726|nr:flagellar hook-length control protein FliK [Bacillus sp. FJAT-45066]